MTQPFKFRNRLLEMGRNIGRYNKHKCGQNCSIKGIKNIILATFNYMQRKTMMIMSLRSLLNYNGQLFALRSKQEISKKLHTYLKLFSDEGFKE